MPSPRPRRRPIAIAPLLACVVLAVGCQNPAPTRPAAASASKRPATSGSPDTTAPSPPARPGAAWLTGQLRVRVAVQPGMVIANNGAGIISNNGGTIVSDNGGGLVANNGGGLIADAGAGLTAKAKYRVAQAPAGVAELALADAVVGAFDAAGKPLPGPDGQPLQARSDATGRYAFAAPLPAGGVVLRVALAEAGLLKGGELSALATADRGAETTLAIDTATTLGAAYVLDQYVGGDQATFDRLPAAATTALYDKLRAATAALPTAPDYRPAATVALVAALRPKETAVDQALETIRALLLGQARGGDGRPADRVAIATPKGLARLPDGRLLIGERRFGRIRVVGPDGTMGTYADKLRGEVKTNFPDLHDLAVGPDGSVYVASAYQIFRIRDGVATVIAGGSTGFAGAVGVPATATTFAPNAIAVAPDGTIYIGEGRFDAKDSAARLLAIGPDGILRQEPMAAVVPARARIQALEMGPGGVIDAVVRTGDFAVLYRHEPGKGGKLIGTEFELPDIYAGIAYGPGGEIFVSSQHAVLALAADGTRRVVAGRGGPAATAALGVASSLLFEPDGTLLIADMWRNSVFALAPSGAMSLKAGASSAVQGGADLRELAMAAPGGAAFDATGTLVMAPLAARELVVLDGAGARPWIHDGAPSNVGAVGSPAALAYRGTDLIVLDSGNRRILKVAPDGSAQILAGAKRFDLPSIAPGERVPALTFDCFGEDLVLDPAGRPYWVSTARRQVYRLADDGFVELVAGKPHVRVPGEAGLPVIDEILAPENGDGGPATAANLVRPTGLVFDAAGDLLIVDAGLAGIRKVKDPGGPAPTIERLYGASPAENLANLASLAVGDAPDARKAAFIVPLSARFDGAGNLIVSEAGSVALPLLGSLSGVDLALFGGALPDIPARIRKIAPDGRITVIAGPGGRFFTDPAGPDALLLPMGLAIAPDGRLAICDAAANLVRLLPAGTW